MPAGNRLRNGQPQARASLLTGTGRIKTGEAIKNALLLRRWDAGPTAPAQPQSDPRVDCAEVRCSAG